MRTICNTPDNVFARVFRKVINVLENKGFPNALLWIPSQVGIFSNETAHCLQGGAHENL